MAEKPNLMAVFTEKRDALATRWKWGLGLVTALVLAPLSYLVAYAILGVTAALSAGLLLTVVYLVGVNAMPALSMRLANWKLKQLKLEAERNPVETLQVQQTALEAALDREAEQVTAFDGEVETYRSSLVREVEAGHPEAAAAGLPILKTMEQKLVYRRLKFQQAQRDIAARATKVQQAEAGMRVALAAQRLSKAAGETQQSTLDRILENIAFASVDSTVNRSMAELRTSIMVDEVPAEELARVQSQVPALSAPTMDAGALLQALQPSTNVIDMEPRRSA